MKNWNIRIDKALVHRLKVLDLESDVRPGRMFLRASWVDGEVEIATLSPRVFVVAAADPGISRSTVVAALKWNADQLSVEAGGPLEIRGPQKHELESAQHCDKPTATPLRRGLHSGTRQQPVEAPQGKAAAQA